MNIIEAYKSALNGKRIRREIWTKESYVYHHGCGNMMVNDVNTLWRPDSTEILAEDWVECGESTISPEVCTY